MPLYLDRHDTPDATREETARNHLADLEIAADFAVEFLSYWHDPRRGVAHAAEQPVLRSPNVCPPSGMGRFDIRHDATPFRYMQHLQNNQ